MDDYFANMDEYQNSSKEICDDNNCNDCNDNYKCCDNMENYMMSEEHTICRICNQPINVLNCNPEKIYEGGKQTSRLGMPISELLPDSTSGSVIQSQFISNSSMRTIARLNMYNGIPYKTRSLFIVFTTISDKCSRHNISRKIINESQALYKMISKHKISRGSNRIGIISACIFIACKNCNSPRSSTEISNIMEIDKKVVTKGIKQVQDIIRTYKIPLNRMILDRVTAIDLIDRIVNNISLLNQEDIFKIKTICECFTENHSKELSSCTPPSLAAAIINYYCYSNNLNVDKNIISEKSNVSIVTIQKITNILSSFIIS